MAQESDYSPAELGLVKQEPKKQEPLVKTTLFRDPNHPDKRYVILDKYSPNLLADNMLSYLDTAGFCNVNIFGLSGSGKSTLCQMLVHYLHSKRSFQVHWFVRDQVKDFTKIVNGLTKGVNHILIFDDASFSLEDLNKKDLSDMAKKLTYIRHIVKANVIVFFNVHYSKALKKFFRVAPFKILAAIEMEEIESFKELFGSYSRYKLKDFARYFKNQMVKKSWRVEIDRWNNKYLNFKTDQPFRFSLINEITDLHFMVYCKTGCKVCNPPEMNDEFNYANSKEFVDYFNNSYGRLVASSMIKQYAHSQHGKNSLDSKRTSVWNTISKLDKNNKYNWDEILKLTDELLIKKRPRSYVKKDKATTDFKALNKNEDLIIN